MSPWLFNIYMDGVMREMMGKVNVHKSKVMVGEQSRSEVVVFVCPYTEGIECEKECKIILNGEEMVEVNEFKYLGSVMCKHGGTEGETRERSLRGRKVVGSLGRIMNGRSVSIFFFFFFFYLYLRMQLKGKNSGSKKKKAR